MSRQEQARRLDAEDAQAAADAAVLKAGMRARRRMERELETLILGPDSGLDALESELAAAPSSLTSGPWRDGGPPRR